MFLRNRLQVRELNLVIEHLHSREGTWRKAVKVRAQGTGAQASGVCREARRRPVQMKGQGMRQLRKAFTLAGAAVAQELQEDLEAKDSDKKKILRKLKQTRQEASVLAEQLTEAVEAAPRRHGEDACGNGRAHAYGAGGGGGGRSPVTLAGLHFSVVTLVAAVWWFVQHDHPAVQRKLLFAVLFPVRASRAKL